VASKKKKEASSHALGMCFVSHDDEGKGSRCCAVSYVLYDNDPIHGTPGNQLEHTQASAYRSYRRLQAAPSAASKYRRSMPELGRYEALPNQMQMVKVRDSLPGTLSHASRTKFSLVMAVHGVKPFPRLWLNCMC
jgi:hypothetical protein